MKANEYNQYLVDKCKLARTAGECWLDFGGDMRGRFVPIERMKDELFFAFDTERPLIIIGKRRGKLYPFWANGIWKDGKNVASLYWRDGIWKGLTVYATTVEEKLVCISCHKDVTTSFTPHKNDKYRNYVIPYDYTSKIPLNEGN